jgi:hypothetical protein
MAQEIFKQDASHADYVEAFFSTFDYPNLAWLHYIGKQQFTPASSALLSLAQSETRLGPAKFMLSMGKLCELIEAENAEDVGELDEEVRAYDELLDLVDVQRKQLKDLLDTIMETDLTAALSIADVGSKHQDILAKCSAITERSATRLIHERNQEGVTLFKRIVGNLIGDKRLGVEDTVDLLTLKDPNPDVSNFAIGIQLIYEAKVSLHASIVG